MNKIKVNITTLIMIMGVIYMIKINKSKDSLNNLEDKWNKVKLIF
mgnify:CR=1 FL=1